MDALSDVSKVAQLNGGRSLDADFFARAHVGLLRPPSSANLRSAPCPT